MKKVIIGIRVDPDFKSEAQAEAEKRGVTLSDLLCECIGYGWQGIVEETVKQSENKNSSPCEEEEMFNTNKGVKGGGQNVE